MSVYPRDITARVTNYLILTLIPVYNPERMEKQLSSIGNFSGYKPLAVECRYFYNTELNHLRIIIYMRRAGVSVEKQNVGNNVSEKVASMPYTD